jgi:hypothetical protein
MNEELLSIGPYRGHVRNERLKITRYPVEEIMHVGENVQTRSLGQETVVWSHDECGVKKSRVKYPWCEPTKKGRRVGDLVRSAVSYGIGRRAYDYDEPVHIHGF